SSSSIYLGYNTKALANGDVNETVIGYDATGNGNNTVTIGNSNVLNNYFFGNVIADSFTGPSGQTMTITMSQDGTDCVSSSDGSQVLVSTSCAQKPDKSQGWIQTNRFQYYESYSGYNLDCNSDGDKADWCDSGINATAEVGDPNTSWNQAQTSSLTLTASTVKGAVKYTWTMYADWNGNGSFDGYSIVANGGTCPSDHDGGCFLEEMWPRNQWTEDFNGDTDGFIGSGDQTWMGIDLNNTYNGGSDPDPSDRIVHFNMPTVAKSDCSTCGRVVVSVKARDSKGTVLASSSLTIDPKGINDLSKYSWTIGNWSSIQYGDKMVNALGATYTAFSWYNRGFKYSTSTDNKSSSYGVSYYDAQAFCNQNNARLMTIAELKQVYSLGQSWPTSYVWSLSLDPIGPRHRLILSSDGRVNYGTSVSASHRGSVI
ncbi:MAG TPA: hypothetical protein PKJ54_03165, partial [Candidatus Pacearchaeota archaeon]|nr:hypothetical protein [Candidatus Pacearchaeota archaeon]